MLSIDAHGQEVFVARGTEHSYTFQATIDGQLQYFAWIKHVLDGFNRWHVIVLLEEDDAGEGNGELQIRTPNWDTAVGDALVRLSRCADYWKRKACAMLERWSQRVDGCEQGIDVHECCLKPSFVNPECGAVG
jgi:hypothetical protein